MQPLHTPVRSEIVDFSEDALSQPRCWIASQNQPKQICRVAGVNPWEVLDGVLTDHCRECWPYIEACAAQKSCHLYPIRTRKLREFRSAEQMIAVIKLECRQCLGTTKLDECTSPNCARFRHR
jgi:hypothetical protein